MSMFDHGACPGIGYDNAAYRAYLERCWASPEPFSETAASGSNGERFLLVERQCEHKPTTDIGLCSMHYFDIFGRHAQEAA